MQRTARAFALLAAFALAAPVASAYYHWIVFTKTDGSYVPVLRRFDVGGLTDRTVRFFVPTQGPEPMMPGDSYTALISQIRRAAQAWDGVATSSLRVKFGGVVDEPAPGTGQAAPGIDIVFDDDMPPGVLAQSLPMTPADLSYLGGENPLGFEPILRSKLQLRRDLTARQQASYSEAFFLTIVHEFGHTLGLQHSLTSAAMSTSITRATTTAQPLSADDVAAISLLYPAEGYAASTGVIAGRVVSNGAGVSMASVVALGVDGRAVGTLTLPDGTYRLAGLPPGQYRVYAHPLPPAQQDEGLPAAIQPPRDLAGNVFPASTSFETKFFPGTRDWHEAMVLGVSAAQTVELVNFDLAPRDGPAIHSMQAYVYMGDGHDIPVHAAAVPVGERRYFAFSGPGIYRQGTTEFAPEFSMSVIGGPARLEPETMRYYGQGYSLIVVNAEPVERTTPVAIAVHANGDLYVLPSALTVVPSAAPQLSSVRSSVVDGQSLAILEGANLSGSTRVLFDGVAGEYRSFAGGVLTVAAPPAAGKHRAAIAALDGVQSSGQLGGDPPRFSFNAVENPTISARPGVLTAGLDMMVEVEGSGTDFLQGQTVVGFGSSDIAVRQVWVINRNRLRMNVSVGAAAQPGLTKITVATGLQISSEWVEIGPGAPNQISLQVPAVSLRTGLPGVTAGEAVLIRTIGVPEDLTGWRVLVNNITATTVRGEGGLQVTVPSSSPLGAVKVQLVPPDGRYVEPVLIQVDSPPPTIVQVAAKTTVAGRAEALPGEKVRLLLAGLFDDATGLSTSDAIASVDVRVGGVAHVADALKTLSAVGYELEFTLRPDLAPGIQTISVRVGTRQSYPVPINILPTENKALAQ